MPGSLCSSHSHLTPNYPNLTVWEEAGEPGQNKHRHEEKMKTRKLGPRTLLLCGDTILTTLIVIAIYCNIII